MVKLRGDIDMPSIYKVLLRKLTELADAIYDILVSPTKDGFKHLMKCSIRVVVIGLSFYFISGVIADLNNHRERDVFVESSEQPKKGVQE